MKEIRDAPMFDPGSFDPVLLQDPAFMDMVREFEEKHLHWDELRYRVDDDILPQTWSAMKLARMLSSVRMPVCGMDLSFCHTPRIAEDLHLIDRYDSMTQALDGTGFDGMKMDCLIDEAVASCVIEGADVDPDTVKHMIKSGRGPETLGERMVLNDHSAMSDAVSRPGEPLTVDIILSMHRVITEGTLRCGDGWSGRFRETDDIVVGDPTDEDRVYHVPPAHDLVPGMVEELCGFANGDGVFVHPVIRAIAVHYMIGYIHPFVDGNGRLARALFRRQMVGCRYRMFELVPISAAIGAHRAGYGRAYRYTETDGGDLTYFIQFIFGCIRESMEAIRGCFQHLRGTAR